MLVNIKLPAKRSGNPNKPVPLGCPGLPQIGVKSRFSGVKFSGKSPNPNCFASILTRSGSRRIKFLIISGLAQIAGRSVANDPEVISAENKTIRNKWCLLSNIDPEMNLIPGLDVVTRNIYLDHQKKFLLLLLKLDL